ncbi:MAG TPA: SPOR domain-containing protein [Smithella sp.]|nr:SPOR domain-containing protein [Smithella sp.]
MATGNIKNFELKIGKAGLIIIVAGMAAFLCVAFLFGVDVGKNIDTYPDKIADLPQRALALVWRPARISVGQSAADHKNVPRQTSAGENIDLTFYDALTTKKGIAKADSVPEKPPPATQLNNEEEAAKGNFNIEAQKPAQTANEKVKATPDAKPKEAAADVASSHHQFVIQAAALKEKAKANQISKKISSLGFKSEIIKTDIKGKGIMFRVMASGFENKVKAQEAAQKISSKTGTNCIVKSVDNAAKNN